MRFAVFLSFGFGANVAIASVCKPRTSSGSSTLSTESISATSTASAAISTTSEEAEITTMTSIELSTSATSTAEGDTTTEATESRTASTELSASTSSKTTTIAISTTTAASATTAEITSTAETTTSAGATTTHITTTTEDAFVPIPTFDIKAVGSDVDGQWLRGDTTVYGSIGWYSLSPPILAFSIEDETNLVREINGNYLCVQYGDSYFPNSLTLCDPSSSMAGIVPVTCEQTRDLKLKCSVQGGRCTMDEFNPSSFNCGTIPEVWNQLYMYSGQMENVPFLAIASSSNPPESSDKFEALELKLFHHGE